ncbi:hypothetical protein [Saccharothrix sp. ST-888]|uniref:hypothetical protein n=1 Tax=Saccharothrix sp. ST-888 TaxID=1427391 RepID=UPI0005ED25B2|nr:hypothetical protein [Saccharothrix sp. ST-888]KJK58721.1 hypothetical protein UK12_08455 [Saccharothrix sp. ST-888]
MSTPAPGTELPFPVPAPAAAPRSPALAVAAATGAAVAGALAYGFLMKALDREIGWVVLGVAAAVAFALGKLGGRNPSLPVAGAVLSVFGLFLGQLFGIALYAHEQLGASFLDLFGSELDATFRIWQDTRGVLDLVFYGLAVFEGYTFTRRFAA